MSDLNSRIAAVGIDIGKNSFHLVGQDERARAATKAYKKKYETVLRGEKEIWLSRLQAMFQRNSTRSCLSATPALTCPRRSRPQHQ
jgi:hypothetical protein